MTDVTTTSPLVPPPARRVLDIFFVQAGWKTSVGEAIEANLEHAIDLLRDHRVYILNEAQARDYLKLHYSLVAAVPILVVIDRDAARRQVKTGYGFRLCLGMVRNPEVAVSLFKWGVQMALMKHTDHMTQAVRKSGHRESFEGLIDLLGEGTTHLVEFGAA
ncbi:MAG: hypothetical protein U0872_12540 [Planctomycetaceae bacterium]